MPSIQDMIAEASEVRGRLERGLEARRVEEAEARRAEMEILLRIAGDVARTAVDGVPGSVAAFGSAPRIESRPAGAGEASQRVWIRGEPVTLRLKHTPGTWDILLEASTKSGARICHDSIRLPVQEIASAFSLVGSALGGIIEEYLPSGDIVADRANSELHARHVIADVGNTRREREARRLGRVAGAVRQAIADVLAESGLEVATLTGQEGPVRVKDKDKGDSMMLRFDVDLGIEGDERDEFYTNGWGFSLEVWPPTGVADATLRTRSLPTEEGSTLGVIASGGTASEIECQPGDPGEASLAETVHGVVARMVEARLHMASLLNAPAAPDAEEPAPGLR